MIVVPDGYRVEETDERVMSMGRRWLRRDAVRLARSNTPLVPTYHLRVEKIRFLLYEVVAYQNRLVKV